jgi:hypothetical protein
MRIASRLSSARASRALTSFVAPALVASAFLVGCGDGNGTNDGTGGSGAGGGSSADTLMLTQANNFTADSHLTIPPITAAAGADVQICWDGVTKDIQGHALTTADINDVSFIPLKATQDQVSEWLNTGTLDPNKISGSSYEVLPTGSTTCAKLSEFAPPTGGAKLDPGSVFKIQDGVTYLVVFAKGTQLGFGARTMLFLVPSSSDNTQAVKAQADSSTMLSYKADLHSLTPAHPSATKLPYVDWSGVTKNGQGLDIGKSDISSILIGFYKGKSVTDLETGFLNLQEKTEAAGGPTQSWQIPISTGHEANLANAPGRNGEAPLASFAMTDGTWLMGMFCSGCQNPAPEIVTILVPQ